MSLKINVSINDIFNESNLINVRNTLLLNNIKNKLLQKISSGIYDISNNTEIKNIINNNSFNNNFSFTKINSLGNEEEINIENYYIRIKDRFEVRLIHNIPIPYNTMYYYEKNIYINSFLESYKNIFEDENSYGYINTNNNIIVTLSGTNTKTIVNISIINIEIQPVVRSVISKIQQRNKNGEILNLINNNINRLLTDLLEDVQFKLNISNITLNIPYDSYSARMLNLLKHSYSTSYYKLINNLGNESVLITDISTNIVDSNNSIDLSIVIKNVNNEILVENNNELTRLQNLIRENNENGIIHDYIRNEITNTIKNIYTKIEDKNEININFSELTPIRKEIIIKSFKDVYYEKLIQDVDISNNLNINNVNISLLPLQDKTEINVCIERIINDNIKNKINNTIVNSKTELLENVKTNVETECSIVRSSLLFKTNIKNVSITDISDNDLTYIKNVYKEAYIYFLKTNNSDNTTKIDVSGVEIDVNMINPDGLEFGITLFDYGFQVYISESEGYSIDIIFDFNVSIDIVNTRGDIYNALKIKLNELNTTLNTTNIENINKYFYDRIKHNLLNVNNIYPNGTATYRDKINADIINYVALNSFPESLLTPNLVVTTNIYTFTRYGLYNNMYIVDSNTLMNTIINNIPVIDELIFTQLLQTEVDYIVNNYSTFFSNTINLLSNNIIITDRIVDLDEFSILDESKNKQPNNNNSIIFTDIDPTAIVDNIKIIQNNFETISLTKEIPTINVYVNNELFKLQSIAKVGLGIKTIPYKTQSQEIDITKKNEIKQGKLNNSVGGVEKESELYSYIRNKIRDVRNKSTINIIKRKNKNC